MQKSVVVISNHWHQPGIKVTISYGEDLPKGGIRLEIDLAAFLDGMSAEMTHPMKIWTKAALQAELKRAAQAALEKVKESSATAVPQIMAQR